MKLDQLIDSLSDYFIYSKPIGFEVKGVSCNSKNISDGFVFVAIKGTDIDGHLFIAEAIDKGAKAIVVDRSRFRVDSLGSAVNSLQKVSVIGVKDTRKALARLAREFYGNPSRKIKTIGITGTNGKTTISYLIEAILKEAGFEVGVVGTVNYRFKDRVIPSVNTTPGPIELGSLLADMVKEKIKYVIMEVSSHALDQDRIRDIDFSSAIFTNLTQDHLDYHKTLEDYFLAKAKLFKILGPNSFAVINNDDEYGRRLKKMTTAEIITYAIDNPADIIANQIKFDISHTEFLLTTAKEKTNFKAKLIGRYNVYNILAALSWAIREGIGFKTIKSAIENFYLLPGRLERIDFNANFHIYVDYAHTEDALKNVITTLRELSPKKIIVVFGCGGNRDKAKRPKMGYTVSELADYAIITSDNPRSEEPMTIIEDIKKGIKKNNYCVFAERKEAIKQSLSLAGAGDIILVAGKGHEDYQVLKEGRINFDDRQVIRECLRLMNY